MKQITFLLCTCMLFMLTENSCKKNWLDVNYVPDQLADSSATPDLLLAGVLSKCASQDIEFEKITLENWMGYWCFFNAQAGNRLQTFNLISADDFPGLSAPAPEITYLENKAHTANQTFYEGIAKVVKALRWAQAVDLLNNIPYSEAYQSNIRQPKYDSGLVIYEDLMKQLDQAIPLIKNADVTINTRISVTDIMFHGDKQQWIKFINTLKLRLLIHQANRTDRVTYISREISKIQAEGSGFLNSGENASINPNYTREKPSFYVREFFRYNYYNNYIDDYPSWWYAGANVVALNFLKANEDPRMGFIYRQMDSILPAGAPEPFAQPDPQDFRGNKYGYYIDQTSYPFQTMDYISSVGGTNSTSPVSPVSTGIIKGYDMGAWLLTSIESLFLQAEAIQRGWLQGDAEEAYKTAVMESFRWLNVGGNSDDPSLSDAVFHSWYQQQITLGSTNVSWQAAPDKYKLLMFQKYIAFNGIEPLETWTDYRRNGRFPDLPVSADPAKVSNKIPLRILYGKNDYISNAENVKAQGDINIFESKIWWMP